MTQPWVDDAKAPTTSALHCSSRPILSQCTSYSSSTRSHSNVYRLLAWREISPQARPSSKSLWGRSSKWRTDCLGPRCEIPDARHSLISWVEAESLRHLSAKYCPLLPPPRSTIAAAFSSDGKTLASTHGDHTVKIIDCQTGSCLKMLIGHRRTPWVVRFHPLYPEILASGSLDHEVRLWDANTADCIGSRDFYRPIASIAFHAQGELLAVASGHKLYIWNYNRREERSSPTVVLKTRRSLRAVHFHPHAAPFLLTAEVSDLDSTDYPLTEATSPGYSQYPPPALYLANQSSSHHGSEPKTAPLISSSCLFWPSFVREDGRTSLQHESGNNASENGQQTAELTFSNLGNHIINVTTPMEMSPGELCVPNAVTDEASAETFLCEIEPAYTDSSMDILETTEGHSTGGVLEKSSSSIVKKSDDMSNIPSPSLHIPIGQSRVGSELTPAIHATSTLVSADLQVLLRNGEAGQLHQFFHFVDPACWELPFLQGWLMGQNHAGLHALPPLSNTYHGSSSLTRGIGSDILPSELSNRNESLVTPSAAVATATLGHSRGIGRSSVRHRSRSRLMAPAGPGEGVAFLNVQSDSDSQSGVINIESESATSLPAAATAELPCTVKLRIWPHDIQSPRAPLDAETCRLTIPHAVLCSEMGTHFSPCGRFLAACVACVLPHMELDPGLQSQMQHDAAGDATSPTRHPTSSRQLMYELRIYSLEEATFGMVLASRAIRAAHCLTSIQFSPTSEHILLAYGRRHSSLLRSIVIDGDSTTPIYTILEVYRVSDMELVRVLPSAEDEVNVACFHPIAGGGLVYGTKEGKLRVLHYDGPYGSSNTGSNLLPEENMLEIFLEFLNQLIGRKLSPVNQILYEKRFYSKLVEKAWIPEEVTDLISHLIPSYLQTHRYYSGQWLDEASNRVPPHKDEEICIERNKCLRRYFPDNEDRRKANVEFARFSGSMDQFGEYDCLEDRWKLEPKIWWYVYGSSLPLLQGLAFKLLGQPCSSSCCERNWSTYSFIHSMWRNKITPKCAEDLVFIHTNLCLLSRKSEAYTKGETKMWDIAGDAWDEPFGGAGMLEIANLSLDEPDMEAVMFTDDDVNVNMVGENDEE